MLIFVMNYLPWSTIKIMLLDYDLKIWCGLLTPPLFVRTKRSYWRIMFDKSFWSVGIPVKWLIGLRVRMEPDSPLNNASSWVMHIMKCLKYMEEHFVEVYINKFIQPDNSIFGYVLLKTWFLIKFVGLVRMISMKVKFLTKFLFFSWIWLVSVAIYFVS